MFQIAPKTIALYTITQPSMFKKIYYNRYEKNISFSGYRPFRLPQYRFGCTQCRISKPVRPFAYVRFCKRTLSFVYNTRLLLERNPFCDFHKTQAPKPQKYSYTYRTSATLYRSYNLDRDHWRKVHAFWTLEEKPLYDLFCLINFRFFSPKIK